MEKRDIATAFRVRLQSLVGDERGGMAALLRDAGIDRSALSQFLDPAVDRLPRAETLRRIAEARGVTADWLLSLSNAREGRQEVTPSVQIELAETALGGSPIDQWRQEAAGMKLRDVPSTLPDMLGLDEEVRTGQPENVLGGFRLGEMDVEIAMPVQTLRDLGGMRHLAGDRLRAAEAAARAHGGDLCGGLPDTAAASLRRAGDLRGTLHGVRAVSARRSIWAKPIWW